MIKLCAIHVRSQDATVCWYCCRHDCILEYPSYVHVRQCVHVSMFVMCVHVHSVEGISMSLLYVYFPLLFLHPLVCHACCVKHLSITLHLAHFLGSCRMAGPKGGQKIVVRTKKNGVGGIGARYYEPKKCTSTAVRLVFLFFTAGGGQTHRAASQTGWPSFIIT